MALSFSAAVSTDHIYPECWTFSISSVICHGNTKMFFLIGAKISFCRALLYFWKNNVYCIAKKDQHVLAFTAGRRSSHVLFISTLSSESAELCSIAIWFLIKGQPANTENIYHICLTETRSLSYYWICENMLPFTGHKCCSQSRIIHKGTLAVA